MRIDLPYCGFKNCRYSFDGNCTKPSKQEKCEYWYLLHEEILHEEPEVIRCRDCKHHDGIRCFRWNSTIITGFDDFCSNAEKRGEEDE